VQRLEIDGVEFRDFPALEVPLEHLGGLDGIIGMAVFWDCLLAIDYPAQRMRLTRGALPQPDGREHLALAAGMMLPITDLALGPVQTRALIDSGDTGGLSVTSGFAQRLAFSYGPVDSNDFMTVVGTVLRKRVGRLAVDATLGQHVFERPTVDIVPAEEGARVGGKALAHFTVTFDRRRNVVRFERDAPGPILSPPRRTLGIAFTQGVPSVVDDITRGTPAAALDIRRGDRLLTVEGRAEFSIVEWEAWIAEKKELALVFLRGDQRIEVCVPIMDLVP